MIDYATHCRIAQLHGDGFSVTKIAEMTGLNEKTVSHWLSNPYRRRAAPARKSSKLDDFKVLIGQWLGQADFTAVQIFQKLRKEGYSGGRSILGEYIRLIRPKTRPAFRTLHFEPGEAAQLDWGTHQSLQIGSTRRRLSFFAVVLCHSRLLYVEASVQECMEHVLGSLANAFDYFGGVPRQLIVDNMKTAVIEHRPGCAPKFNARFHEFCAHYGTSAHACNPRRPNEKGRVENSVGYIKGNFFNGLDLGQLPHHGTLESLNARLREWMDQIANVREHKELRARPLDIYQDKESAALIPLNPNPADTGVVLTARVTNRCRVHCASNRYSVPPAYSQKQVQLHCYADRLCIYAGGRLIARHTRSYDRHQQIVDPEHESALIEEQTRGRHAGEQLAFESLGSIAALWLANLLARHPCTSRLHIRQILRLCDLHGKQAVLEALESSHRYEIYTWQTIQHFVEQRSRALALREPTPMAPSASSRKLLEIRLPGPDLSHYPGNSKPTTNNTPTN